MYQMYKIIVNTSNVNTLLMYTFPSNIVIFLFWYRYTLPLLPFINKIHITYFNSTFSFFFFFTSNCLTSFFFVLFKEIMPRSRKPTEEAATPSREPPKKAKRRTNAPVEMPLKNIKNQPLLAPLTQNQLHGQVPNPSI